MTPLSRDTSHPANQIACRTALPGGGAKIRIMTNKDYPHTLHRHPATPAPTVRTIEARVEFRDDGRIEFAYRLWGDMARLLVPTEQPATRTDLLWEHTCFEAFIGVLGEPGYREFNFSPSGQWASYTFSAYRQRLEATDHIEAPQITTRLYAGRLEVDALIPANNLPPNPERKPLELALSAVVEAADTVDGGHSYWALAHPESKPDFHHREAFRLMFSPS